MKARFKMKRINETWLPRKIKKNSPRAVIPIPKEATRRGSIRSERVPAIGEKTDIMIGWANNIKPDNEVSIPSTVCKYSDSI